MSIASTKPGSIAGRPDECLEQLASAMYTMLGIKPCGEELSHYELLGISPDEKDEIVIYDAYDKKAAHVKTFQLSKTEFGDFVAPILSRLSIAKLTVLNEANRANTIKGVKYRF